MKYTWKISGAGQPVRTFVTANPKVTFSKVGVYKALLTVSDSKGGVSSKSFQIKAGNEPPVLSFKITPGNSTFFYPGKPINYSVTVSDKEDGSLVSGGIKASQVVVTADYLAEGYDKVAIAQGHRSADESAQFAGGKALISKSDCMACHKPDGKSIGPSYKQISLKYKGSSGSNPRLAKKIINGGGGVWGEVPMSAHPKISQEDALQMVNYIVNITNKTAAKTTLPVKGTIKAKVPEGDKGEGIYLLRAAYTDRGANGLTGATSEKTFTLRNAKVSAGSYDELNGAQLYKAPGIGNIVLANKGGHIAFNKIDLTGIKHVSVAAMVPSAQANAAGGTLEIRIGSPTGKIIGESTPILATDKPGPLSAIIPIENVNGIHNLYFNFKNPEVSTGRLVYVLLNIEFMIE